MSLLVHLVQLEQLVQLVEFVSNHRSNKMTLICTFDNEFWRPK
jgi:hypothetical protein